MIDYVSFINTQANQKYAEFVVQLTKKDLENIVSKKKVKMSNKFSLISFK